MTNNVHVYTSITSNYLPKAPVLAESVKRLDPGQGFLPTRNGLIWHQHSSLIWGYCESHSLTFRHGISATAKSQVILIVVSMSTRILCVFIIFEVWTVVLLKL
jgi:K+ transporter